MNRQNDATAHSRKPPQLVRSLKKPPDIKSRRGLPRAGLLATLLLLFTAMPGEVLAEVTSCDPGYYLNGQTCTVCPAGKS